MSRSDLSAWWERLLKSVVFKHEPRKLPWSMFATFLAPDGNLYGLREAIGR
jgi:hypothetical protein